MKTYKVVQVQESGIWVWTVETTLPDNSVIIGPNCKSEAEAQEEVDRLSAIEARRKS